MKEKIRTLLSELSKNKIYSTIAFALSVVLLFTCCGCGNNYSNYTTGCGCDRC